MPEFGEHGLEPPQNDVLFHEAEGYPLSHPDLKVIQWMALPSPDEIKAQIQAGVPGRP